MALINHINSNKLSPGNFVIITFKDNGENIPADKLSSFFEPDFTLEKGKELDLYNYYCIIVNMTSLLLAGIHVAYTIVFDEILNFIWSRLLHHVSRLQ